jgi:hypothetical protein
MRTRPQRDPQQGPQCIYGILCECGRTDIGEAGGVLTAQLLGRRLSFALTCLRGGSEDRLG